MGKSNRDHLQLPASINLSRWKQKDLNLELASHFQLRLEETSERKWSGGRTKIELIRLLSSYEQGMLLNEPTTHLDRKSIDRLIEELRYYYGTLVLLVMIAIF